MEEVKNRTKALGESIYKETFIDSFKAHSKQINVILEDSAIETKIFLLADAMENLKKLQSNIQLMLVLNL